MYKYTKVDQKELLPFNSRYIVSLDNHVELVEALAAFCRKKGIKAGQISGIGAVSEATFRFLDPATKQYVDKTFAEQMEITSIAGNISEKDGQVYLHIHLTCSRRDYSCVGGHLLSARINGACELLIDAFHTTFVGRYADEETGLNLYKF
ncbi:MAG: DNA-binding protein [Bacteroidales bacterium]|nr:DNA-binding protein [Bacteroidales bacterium]